MGAKSSKTSHVPTKFDAILAHLNSWSFTGTLSLAKFGIVGDDACEFVREIGSSKSELKRYIIRLDLSHCKLASLPAEIKGFTSLRRLDLSHNQLTTIPEDIGYLKNLAALIVSDNHLASLPVEIGAMTNLVTLDVTRNPGVFLHLRDYQRDYNLVNTLAYTEQQIGTIFKQALAHCDAALHESRNNHVPLVNLPPLKQIKRPNHNAAVQYYQMHNHMIQFLVSRAQYRGLKFKPGHRIRILTFLNQHMKVKLDVPGFTLKSPSRPAP